jgi:hypothetical protein
MEKLPIEFKQKWVEALRSGEYEQGSDALYKGGKYCCLGVACVVAGIPKETIEGESYISWYAKDIPGVIRGDTQNEIVRKLSFMNDGNEQEQVRKHSFDEIADYIDHDL